MIPVLEYGRRTVLGSLAECQEMQCLASQNLEGYEAVGKAFPVCNDLKKN